jgi:MFS family permease
LGETLHETDPAAGGAVVGELFFVATATVVVLRRLERRTAMLGGVGLLIPSLALLVMVQSLRSMPVLVVGTALGGAACALGYRGSLQVINRIAPADRRAEVVSSYLVAGNVGIAIPIIGIGLTKQLASATTADLGFAIVIALFAILALVTGLKYAPER